MWIARIISFCLAAMLVALPAQAARLQFCWIGAIGYTMEGIIGFPETLLGTGIITEKQVTEFRIQGYH